ncbi:MAG: DUF3426 domain-containing protein [Alphaproteobacteria bacterium]|nr:MAG: DUF3426 domain-containing protein [Alphaproteobacteria bacterium]
MILTCSVCATRYSIDPASIGPEGRAVKCAKCGHKWREFPPEDMPKTIAEPVPAKEAAENSPSEGDVSAGLSIEQMTAVQNPVAGKKPGKRRKWLSWILLLAILIVLLAGAFFARNQIVAIVPDTAKVYQLFRIDVKTDNVVGLEIHDLKTRSVLQSGVTTLTVTGQIKNVTDSTQLIPRIKVSLLDDNGQLVYSWTTTVEEREVPAWGQVEFSTSMNQPPAEAKNVKVDLIALGGHE